MKSTRTRAHLMWELVKIFLVAVAGVVHVLPMLQQFQRRWRPNLSPRLIRAASGFTR